MSGDTGTPLVLVSTLVEIFGGILLVSMLIGIVTSRIETRIDQPREGRALFSNNDSTLSLGWSSEVFAVFSDQVDANASQQSFHLTSSGDKNKFDANDEIRQTSDPDLQAFEAYSYGFECGEAASPAQPRSVLQVRTGKLLQS